jgi:GNAT superfamily N-acetyltransferase
MKQADGQVKIRGARQADTARIAELSGQLGYPATTKQMAGRVGEVLRQKSGKCLVAETSADGVIGWIHVSVTPLLEVERRAEINGLVVDEKARSRGAGLLLLEKAEGWARRMKCTGINVRSNVIRERAHEFYERHEYEHYKTQKAFRKKL